MIAVALGLVWPFLLIALLIAMHLGAFRPRPFGFIAIGGSFLWVLLVLLCQTLTFSGVAR